MHKNRSQYTFVEYQQKLRNGYSRLGIVSFSHEKNCYYIFRPIPNCPWLPESRKKYFRKIRSRLGYLNPDRHYTFCTLTYSTRRYTTTAVAKRVKHDIDLFFKRLDYRKSRPEYFYVIELTDDFYVHIHLIFDRFVHKSKIRASWANVTKSPVTKIEDMNSKQAFYYITKYLSNCRKQHKGKWSFIFKHIDRIWTASRNFWGQVEPGLKDFEFWFMCWNKDGIISQFFNDPDHQERGSPLTDDQVAFLKYDADNLGCITSVGGPGTARQLSHLALTQPVQPLFDFFTSRLSLID